MNGTERLGVPPVPTSDVEDELAEACRDVAALLAEMVMTRSRYGAAVERAGARSR